MPRRIGDPAAGLEWRLDRHDDALAVGLVDTFGDLGERAAVDRRHARVDEGALAELTRHQADAPGAEDVGRVVPAPRLHVGDDRRRGRDAIEVVDREVDAELACDRDEMEDAVRRAARAGDRRRGVLDRIAA